MTLERIKEEIKLHTEILKFLMVVLLASAGGMLTLYNLSALSSAQQNLITVGWIFIPVLLIGILALFLYVYSLLKKI
jgi:hypothetical protein